MKKSQLVTYPAKGSDKEKKEQAVLARAIGRVIAELASEGKSVAIPGFGTFEAVKTDEYVAADPQTGERMLMPPHISVEFRTGSRLRKSISGL